VVVVGETRADSQQAITLAIQLLAAGARFIATDDIGDKPRPADQPPAHPPLDQQAADHIGPSAPEPTATSPADPAKLASMPKPPAPPRRHHRVPPVCAHD
jgi:hypothetical protein